MIEHKIPFTQFLLPDGRQITTHHVTEDKETYDKAMEIIQNGFVFEVEFLSNGMVSATISSKIAEADLASALSFNGPAVVTAIAKMIKDFDIKAALAQIDDMDEELDE